MASSSLSLTTAYDDSSSIVSRVMKSLIQSQPLFPILTSTSTSTQPNGGSNCNVWPSSDNGAMPIALIEMIIGYQLSYDSIAYALELQLSSYYVPITTLLLNITAVSDLSTAALYKSEYHDEDGICVQLSRLSHQYWTLSSDNDDTPILERGRAYYKLACYALFGLNIGRVDGAAVVTYIKNALNHNYYRAHLLLSSALEITNSSTAPKRPPMSRMNTDIVVRSSMIVMNQFDRDHMSTCQSLIRYYIDKDPTDHCILHLLSHVYHSVVVLSAHRGFNYRCTQVGQWYFNGINGVTQEWDAALPWLQLHDRYKSQNNANIYDTSSLNSRALLQILAKLPWCSNVN
jgi:hypothetical protein